MEKGILTGKGIRREAINCEWLDCAGLVWLSQGKYCEEHKKLAANARKREWELRNPEKAKQQKAAYRLKHPEKIKQWHLDHKKPCQSCGTLIKHTSTFCQKCNRTEANFKKGQKPWNFKGWRYCGRNRRYKEVWVEGRGYIREHRLVMENIMGRQLLTEEEVHHKDGDGLNNDPWNLQLINKHKHLILEHKQGTYTKHLERLHARR